jgi:hypothetical protein
MITTETRSTFAVDALVGVPQIAAASPRPRGMSRAAVSPLRSWGEVCPQAVSGAGQLSFVNPAQAGTDLDGRGLDVRMDLGAHAGTRIDDRPGDLGFLGGALSAAGSNRAIDLGKASTTQYGNTSYGSGTRVWKPPV